MTRAFLCDGYADRPRSEREAIEARIAALRARLWSEPESAAETREALSEAQAELRRLDQDGSAA